VIPKDKKWPLYVAVIALIASGFWLIYYKADVFGYALTPNTSTPVWLVEAEVAFRAVKEQPIKVTLSVPQDSNGFRILEENSIAPGYSLNLQDEFPGRRAIWSRRNASGIQRLYYRLEVFDAVGGPLVLMETAPEKPIPPLFNEPIRESVNSLVQSIHEQTADASTFSSELLKQLASANPTPEVIAVKESGLNQIELARALLAIEGIPSRLARGIRLEGDRKRQPIEELIDIYTEQGWALFDPQTGNQGLPPNFLLWQRGEISLLDVEGGRGSSITISVIRKTSPSKILADERVERSESSFWNLTVYSLPIAEQNVFKKLFVIPLGALIVVLIRNLVGFRTSGTFMPILLALSFLETKLVPGILILLVMIAVGLLIRHYLSKLNLLLVPRISVGVIMVIFIMATISILSFQVGLDMGMKVTFFPMIIIAWTIERMSIAMEEQGSMEVAQQLGGSLCVAIIVYLAMSNATIKHFMYAFPEINLVILGIILLMGVYTGYRLTELGRFEPLVRDRDETKS
jgi:hypothetical protein